MMIVNNNADEISGFVSEILCININYIFVYLPFIFVGGDFFTRTIKFEVHSVTYKQFVSHYDATRSYHLVKSLG